MKCLPEQLKGLEAALKVFIELGSTSIYQLSREYTLNLQEDSIEDVLDMMEIKERPYIINVKNGRLAKFSGKLNDGDNLVVFPPIGGGN